MINDLFESCRKSTISIRDQLRAAYRIAWTESDDPDTKNGAVLVEPALRAVVIGAANAIPHGVDKHPQRLLRPLKYDYIAHAERAVITRAACYGIATAGKWLVCPWAACTVCAQTIIDAGIRRVITHKAMMDRTPERWADNIVTAQKMLREAGVAFEVYEGEIGGVDALMNGEEWKP